MKKLAKLLVAVLVVVSVRPDIALAQHTQSALLSVEPAQLNFELSEASSSASSIIVITNQHDYPVSLLASFQAIDETAGRIIPSGNLDSPLTEVLKLSETKFDIAAQSRYFLTVSVSDTASLQSGGHYAVLVLEDASSSNSDGSVHSQVSIGTFVVKRQGEVKRLVVTERRITRRLFDFPSRIRLELLNDGNVHLTPRGYIRIFDNDTVYYETVLNTDSTLTLPSQRFIEEREIAIHESGWLPKKITIEVGYRADGIDEAEVYTDNFWYVPRYSLPLPFAVIALIVIGVLLSRKRHRRSKTLTS